VSDLSDALKHKYRVTPGGEIVPGVTSVINILDKPALKWASSQIAAHAATTNTRRKKAIVAKHREWLARPRGKSESAQKKYTLANMGTDDEVYIHWARGEFDRQWRAKADRGTRVHDVAERWTKGESVKVLPEDNGFVDALEVFHKEYRPKFSLVECIVINQEFKYGGRFDAICELNGPGAEGFYLIDYKTGGSYPYEVALQAQAYWDCKLATWNDDGSLGTPTPLPEVHGARTVYLREDGTLAVTDPFAKVSQADARMAFRTCLTLFNINKAIDKELDKGESDE
jgi:hypothetical protein